MSMVDTIKKDGIVKVKDFFDKSLIKSIFNDWKEVLQAQIKQNGIENSSFEDSLVELFKKNNTAFKNCGKLCYGLNSLFKLGCSDRMISLVKKAGVKKPIHNTRPVILVNSNRTASHKDYSRYPAHQDWRGSQGSLNSVVVWCPLVNIEKKHGPLEFVRGSHKWGLLEADESFQVVPPIKENIDESYWENTGTMNIGDAVVFSTLLIHRSGEIQGDNFRWSASFRFNDVEDKTYIERGFVEPYTYKPSVSLITPDFPNVSQIEDCFNGLS